MEIGVVIPVGPGRLENLRDVLRSVAQQTSRPKLVVLVADGPEAHVEIGHTDIPVVTVNLPKKHEPGMEQPRNVGVRAMRDVMENNEQFAGLTHVWFLDTDVLVEETAAEEFHKAMAAEPEPRILLGPYEWMAPGVREPTPDLHNDPRADAFKEHQPWDIMREDLSAGLACFSGNLVWPIAEFERVGGFWSEIHHGRCEDGELGLRAVSMGVGISYVSGARGYHMDHPRNMEWIEATNAIDVPKLNARHNYKELGYFTDAKDYEMFVVDEDGKRFDCKCRACGATMNTAEIWAHPKNCPRKFATPPEISDV